MTSMDLSKDNEQVQLPAQNKKSSVSTAVHNGKFNIQSNIKIMIIILIMHLVAAPLMLINQMAVLSTGTDENIQEIYGVIGVISTAIAILSGVVVAISNFSYLYKKTQVDMSLSLPMTVRGRFISDFISGLITYLVPYIAVQILTFILAGIGHLAYDGKTFMIMRNNYYAYAEPHAYTCTVFEDMMPYIVKLVVGGFFIMLFVYVLTILVTACCGSLFETIAYTGIVNGMIPGTIAVVLFVLFGNLYGIDIENTAVRLISWTSPFGGCLALINLMGNDNYFKNMASWLIPYIIIIAIAFIASYFLYKSRKAEHVSRPFVYKGFYYVMITCITFCIGSAFLYTKTDNFIIPLIVLTAIVYLVFEVITNRGFKKIWISVIRYAVTLGCVTGLYFLITETGGFGMETRVPSADSVKSVVIDYQGYWNTLSGYGQGSDFSIILKDKENIETIVKAHQQIVNNGNPYENYEHYQNSVVLQDPAKRVISNGGIEIKYNLKNGMQMIRKYNVLSYDVMEILKQLDTNKEYREQFINKTVSNLKKDYYQEAGLNIQKTNGYDNSYYKETSFYVGSKFEGYSSVGSSCSASQKYSNLPITFIDQLCSCYENDLRAENPNNYISSDKPSAGYMIVNNMHYVIKDSYTNTINFLSSYNLMCKSSLNKENITNVVLNGEISLYSYNDYLEGSDLSNVISGLNMYYSENNYVTDYSDDLKTLLEVALDRNITNEKCYTISVGNKILVIPMEYSYIAERVYETVGAYQNQYDKYNGDVYYDEYAY